MSPKFSLSLLFALPLLACSGSDTDDAVDSGTDTDTSSDSYESAIGNTSQDLPPNAAQQHQWNSFQ